MLSRYMKLVLLGLALVTVPAAAYAGWRLLAMGDGGVANIFSGIGTRELLIVSIALGVGLLIGLASAVPLRRSVASSVQGLADEVARLADKGPGAKLPVSGPEPVSQLAYTINNLLAAVERPQQDLQRENAELRKNIKTMRTLTEIDREITAKSQSMSILDLVCRRAPDLLGVPMAAVVLKDNPGRVVSSYGLSYPDKFETWEGDLLGEISSKGTPFGHGIYSFDGGAVESLLHPQSRQTENIQAAAAALLVVESQILGALLVFDKAARSWSVDETQCLSLLAGQVALALDAAWLFEEEESRRAELSSLYDLSRVLADANPDTDSILDMITRNAVDKVHVTFARAAILEGDRFVIRSANPARILNQKLDQPISEAESVDFLKEIIEVDRVQVIHREDISLSRIQERDLLLESVRTICLVPMKTDKGTRGVLILGEERSQDREPFTDEKRRLARNIGDQAVSSLRRAELFEELASAYLETVMALANAVDIKDTYTGDHGRRLADMALAIGRRLEMKERDLKNLHYGAILHDIGKIGIPDAILQKPARLNKEEWQYIQKHPILGERILAPVSYLSGAAAIVRHHHERFDGLGYPDGIAGEAIPLGARIMTVVDSFFAMLDKRSYKEARPVSDAVAELEKCSGSHFDPRIVAVLVQLLEEGVFKGLESPPADESPGSPAAA